MNFEGNVAVVTGAGRMGGIGEAIALRLAKNDVSVAIVDNDPNELEAVAERVTAAGTKCLPIVADVSQEAAVSDVLRQVEDEFGELHMLFNNAAGGRGAGPIEHTPVTKLSRDDWDFTLSATLTSVFLCSKWAAPLIEKSGGGAIVNTSTMSAHHGMPGLSAFCSAKFALEEFTRTLALELAPKNIRVNSFSPGMTITPALRRRYEAIAAANPEQSADDHMRMRMGNIPLGRMAEPDEMASVACFLASNDASYMIGQTLQVDGGRRI